MIPSGSQVSWTSSAGGHSKTKSGIVVAHVPKGEDIRSIPALGKVPFPRWQHNIKANTARADRYLVKVDRGSYTDDDPDKWDYYAPYAGTLEAQNPAPKKGKGASWPCAQPSVWGSPSPVQPPKQASQKKQPPAPPPPVLRNHFVLVVDKSTSIRSYGLTSKIRELVNENIEQIKRETKNTGQITTLTLVQFGSAGDIRTTVDNQNIASVRPLGPADYMPNGNTALLDAVGLTVEHLERQPDAKDPNLSMAVIVLTDGEENHSVHYANPGRFRSLIEQTQKTDRYTYAFLLPPGKASSFAQAFGIPRGNVREWEQTQQGAQEASVATQSGVSQFYTARSAGQRSVSTFYTDLSKVTVTDLRHLDDLTHRFKSWTVEKEGDIETFCKFKAGTFVLGAGYYELTKPEEIQDHKALLLVERGKKVIYGGPKVRSLLGLPSTGSAKVKPLNHANYRIFVQSTSVNRKLVRGTLLLYDIQHVQASPATWQPVPQPVSN